MLLWLYRRRFCSHRRYVGHYVGTNGDEFLSLYGLLSWYDLFFCFSIYRSSFYRFLNFEESLYGIANFCIDIPFSFTQGSYNSFHALREFSLSLQRLFIFAFICILELLIKALRLCEDLTEQSEFLLQSLWIDSCSLQHVHEPRMFRFNHR